MNAILTQALNTQSGFVSAATSGLNNTIKGINQQITQLQNSAASQTALLQQQFNAMQTQVAQLQSVGQYLTAFFNPPRQQFQLQFQFDRRLIVAPSGEFS
jgi:Flagellar capping protein